MNKYNLLLKRKKDFEYIITDFIATKLTKKQFEILQSVNQSLLGDFVFCDYNDTDFSWWAKTHKYLTRTKLKINVDFYCDFHGNIYMI